MADEGIGEVVGIINCTLEGAKLAGGATVGTIKMAGALTKESAKLITKLMKLLYQVSRYMAVDRKYNKTSGKTSAKVLQTKFSNFEYDEVKFTAAKESIRSMCQGMDEKQLAKVTSKFNEKALRNKFNELAKKNGLLYCRIPNFVENADTNKIEYRYVYPAEQAKANAETRIQFTAYINKLIKEAGIKDEKLAKQIVDEIVPADRNMPLAQAVDRMGLYQCSDEHFDTAMKECYPEYDAKEFLPVEPSEEKKRNFTNFIGRNELNEERLKGNVKDMTIPYSNILYQDRGQVKFVHPDYANVIVTVRPEDVIQSKFISPEYNKDKTAMTSCKGIQISLRNNNTYECEILKVNKQTLTVSSNKRYLFNFDELDKFMKSQNAKARREAKRQKRLEGMPKLTSVTRQMGKAL